MRVVLRIGGSVVASPINTDLISSYSNLLTSLKANGNEIVAVVGGGKLAREFIKVAENIGLNETSQDEIAISVSRLFAQLILKTLGKEGGDKVATTLNNVSECLREKKIAVMGGLRPGITTDAVASLVAEHIKADLLVKGTDQDGVYNKDPRKHVDAIKLDHMPLDDLPKVFSENTHKAGIHQIVDPIAIRVLQRYRIKMIIVNGFHTENISAAINGKKVGTIID